MKGPTRSPVAPPPPPPSASAALASALAGLAAKKTATAAQRRLSKRVEDIERTRAELKSWQDYDVEHQKRLISQWQPLQQRLHRGQRQLVQMIDALLSRPRHSEPMSRAHRTLLREMLVGYASSLLQNGPDTALAALLEKHSPHQDAADLQFASRYLSQVLGRHLDGGDGRGVRELLENAGREMEKQRQGAAKMQWRAESAVRKQAAHKAEAQNEMSALLHEVYDMLTERLIADAENNSMPRSRAHRAQQRVNQAYEAGDLVSLLGERLLLEQGDVAELLPARQWDRYSRALQHQWSLWQDKLSEIYRSYAPLAGRDCTSLKVQDVDRQLTRMLERLSQAVEDVGHDIQKMKQPKERRELLDAIERQRQQRMEAAMLITLDSIMTLSAPQEPGSTRARRDRA